MGAVLLETTRAYVSLNPSIQNVIPMSQYIIIILAAIADITLIINVIHHW